MRCSTKKVFFEIWENSQENTFAWASFLIKLYFCEFCKIFKNTFSYRTLPVAASEENLQNTPDGRKLIANSFTRRKKKEGLEED